MFTAKIPRVSVVMPVHNALPYLDAAVESVIGQTFRDFEFVILDDASTDGSTTRLREWAGRDARIRLIEEPENLGPAGSSERVAQAATAPVVARMDADDISLPTRLAEQLAVLDQFPDVGVVGGLCDIVAADGRLLRRAELWRLLQHGSVPPFGNGPMMYRREVFDAVGGYRQECELWEDHALLLRMSAVTQIMVVPHAVYQIRQSPVSTRFASKPERLEEALDLMYRCRDRLEQGDSYEDLLRPNDKERSKLDPRVFMSAGSVALWAGGHPRLFRRALARARLRWNLSSAKTLVWTVWASLEPYSLRAFIRSLLFFRGLYASIKVGSTGPVKWPGPAQSPAHTVSGKTGKAERPRPVAINSAVSARHR
jgi:glycosyltransferase involved in cell wall biosynthesis